MCAAPAPGPGPAPAPPSGAVVPPPARLNEFLFNQGCLKRNVTSVKVIVIHAGFGDATLIEVEDTTGEYHFLTIILILSIYNYNLYVMCMMKL